MKHLNLADKCRVIGAWLLIKTGKLTYDAFTQAELNELVKPYFPQTLNVEVPVGNATLICEEAELMMPASANHIDLQLMTDFRVEVLGNPIYRAHLIAVIRGTPEYRVAESRLEIGKIELTTLALVHDEYSLVKDTTYLMQQMGPLGMATSLASPLKSIVNTVTGGLSDAALNYLRGYTQGNKQKILDDNKPAIERALIREIEAMELSFSMADDVWREYLFSRHGKRVTVDDHQLKFWFT